MAEASAPQDDRVTVGAPVPRDSVAEGDRHYYARQPEQAIDQYLTAVAGATVAR